MASTYATRTVGTATNNNKFTISVWSKRSKLTGDYQGILTSRGSGWDAGIGLYWGNDESVWYNFSTSSTALATVSTTAKHRDVNSWYHIVIAGDTTQSGTNKLKIWVNGEQQTSFTNDDRSSFVGLSNDLGHTGYPMQLGRKHDGSYYYDGLMSHLHFVDGTAYDASAFGETDTTTGEWKAKTSPSVNYGNNGFLILKDGNTITDQSSNSNNFTLGGGTLTDLKDNPDNIFATINPLDFYYGGQASGSLSNGNTKIQTAGSGVETYTLSTLGASSGKYYCEMKLVSSTAAHQTRFGIAYEPSNSTSDWLGKRNVGWSYRQDGKVTNNSSNYSGTWNSYTSGDIIGMAIDLDNNKLYFSKNGVFQNSGVPTSGSTGTGGVTLTADKTYLIGIGDETGGYSVCELNFGNGYFGTTAITTNSGNGYAGAEGSSKFNYQPPTGYSALSTKGLNE